MTKIAIHGAGGRMGCRLIDLAQADAGLELVAALESPDHPRFGEDAGEVAGIGSVGVPLGSDLPPGVQAVVDFSTHHAIDAILDRCVSSQLPLVIATTGLSPEQIERVKQAASAIPIVYAPNMSLAVNLTMKLAETAAAALSRQGERVDVEIIERHHRFKEDSPSGTALKFGELIRSRLGLSEETHGRHGMIGQRPADEIGYHAVRTGDNPGEHTIIFGLLGETVELRVAATDRDCYARGALAAGKFVVGRDPGLYTMYDVLGL